jgi:tryptophan synthase alpha chain
MTSRVPVIFEQLRAAGRRGLMPFVVGEHPAIGSTARLLPELDRAGASIIEVGIPFSDPIADGPVIAAAMHKALGAGATPIEVFDQVASVRGQVKAGLVAMCSVSIVWRMGGAAGFCRRATDAGFDGLIIPDAPLEESGDILSAAGACGLTCSLLVAPSTPPRRAGAIARASTGFVYLLARAGITGERAELPDVEVPVRALRAASGLPIACGFGVSTPEHVRAVVRYADAAIVGSALVRRVEEAHAAGADAVAAAGALVRELSVGLEGPAAA